MSWQGGDRQKHRLNPGWVSPSATGEPQGTEARSHGAWHWEASYGPAGLERHIDHGAPGSPILQAVPGGLALCLFLPDEIFALSYIPTEQIDLFKNVNQTKSFLFLKHSQGK